MSRPDLGTQIRNGRHAIGISAAELAARVGTSGPRVSQWETGGCHPRLEHLPAIARALHRPLDFDVEGGRVMVTNTSAPEHKVPSPARMALLFLEALSLRERVDKAIDAF